jgi:polysaccharide export outer membrane protein
MIAASTAPPAAAGIAAARPVDIPSDYVIGSGDTLAVNVWKEPEASVPSVVVRPDGRVALPLLKEVQVAGLTPAQAEKAITEGLSKLIVSGVDVTVVVTAINSKKIYVMGAVRREGAIPYTYRMTIMQAIGEAGGLNDFARRKKIYVLRQVAGANTRLPFNYDEVIRGAKPEQNVELLPGDTLVVPH